MNFIDPGGTFYCDPTQPASSGGCVGAPGQPCDPTVDSSCGPPLGGDPCVGSAFAPVAGCPTGGPPAQQPKPKPPTRTCDIEFGSISIAGLGRHTFLRMSYTENGQTYSSILEGVKTDPSSPGAPTGLNPKWTYLNAWDTLTGAYSGYSSAKITWDAQKAGISDICHDSGLVYERFAQYKNWVLQYHWKAGPNSNSFMHWLVEGVSDLSGITPPFLAVGWNKDGLIPF